jgi:hypothetical protein
MNQINGINQTPMKYALLSLSGISREGQTRHII